VKATKPHVTPHVFVADPQLVPHPRDLERRGVCLTCHLVGQPGDAHHAMPEPVEDAASRAAGDRGDPS
jgi:hypothetical protein